MGHFPGEAATSGRVREPHSCAEGGPHEPGSLPPAGLHDLVIGINRWSYRLVAYLALMTDQYPPLRLDQGDDDPEGPPAPAATSDTAQ